MKKNILIITNNFPDKNNNFINGIFIKNQLDYLSDDYNFHVIVPSAYFPKFLTKFWPFKNYKYFASYTGYDNGKYKVYAPRFYAIIPKIFHELKIRSAIKSVIRCINRNNIKFDFIHAHFAYPSGNIASEIKKLFNKPLIITAHAYDILEEQSKNSVINLSKKALLNSDFIITVSENNKNVLNKRLNEKKNIIIIPNSYDEEIFNSQNKIETRKDLNLPINKKILINVGSLEEIKRHKDLIKAMPKLSNNIILLIIGDGILQDNLKSQVKRLNLNERVKFLGKIDQKNISRYLNASDLFVMTSRSEGLPTAMIESFGTGTPCVATNVGGIPQLVNEKNGILISYGSLDELIKSIKKALEKKWDNIEIIKSVEKYTQNRTSKQLKEVYDEF